MISAKKTTKISKFLSLVLRHKPETIGILLDANGWADVSKLIKKSNENDISIDMDILKHVVDTNAKKRFAFNPSMDKIRASQGHSVNIELGYTNQKPPDFLFHGTSKKSVASILKTGLEKRNRQHVHLSSDIETAITVGRRHGKPVVLTISSAQMHQVGFAFYLSENGVWLTEYVPKEYLEIKE